NSGQDGLPWLELEVESVRGQLKARPTYTLSLQPARPDDENPGPRWRVRVELTVTPRRAGIGRFAVALPPGCQLDRETVFLDDRVRSYNPQEQDGKPVLDFRLKSAESTAPEVAPAFVSFECDFDPGEKDAAQAALPLPRPLGMLEEDGSVKVTAT